MKPTPPFCLFQSLLLMSTVMLGIMMGMLLTGQSQIRVYSREDRPTYIPAEVTNRPAEATVKPSEPVHKQPADVKYTPGCEPRTKLAFIKTHKTGGTTLMQILHRLAYLKDLDIIMEKSTNHGSINAFYNHGIKKEDLIPPRGKHYDILAYHTKYNREITQKALGPNATYITLLREPLGQLRSQFNFYWMAKSFKISGPNPLAQFLKDPAKYDHRSPGYMATRNPMASDLGFGKKELVALTEEAMKNNEEVYFPRPPAKVEEFIRNITSQLDLTMIMEYFDESLVLLKRLMCWDLQDILYFKSLSFNYKAKEEEISEDLVKMHRRWDVVDYFLYHHFNRTFWNRVEKQGDDFWGEVKHFKEQNLRMQTYCVGENIEKTDELSSLVVEETKWNSRFLITPEFCTVVKYGQFCFMTLLRDRYFRHFKKSRKTSKPIDPLKTKMKSLYEKPLCEICDIVSRDCTFNEYLTHLYHDKLISRAKTSFHPSGMGGRGKIADHV
ncbi:PREDICTED: galactosylceramide sulfotransferase-like [Branchiostoma belcheri]|uniref:Galactosylceramide sulfotransferase-like n=1 Tax=Branchiostoma belcheri TaxID=7741 RepID=A0A6P4XB50_BRABE|nr:PREDICTED: galactosylceramide sulfotransferase-like [Branchiostoma belcheri]XP_019613685.1 PREDICTED: galactosylceramide sulfotransferase-like [Branchiostoma belcheri]XP_019613686.1 PREDICTED: galactosylceramide sulfotransferase-like [Branchiostoma belcheri]